VDKPLLIREGEIYQWNFRYRLENAITQLEKSESKHCSVSEKADKVDETLRHWFMAVMRIIRSTILMIEEAESILNAHRNSLLDDEDIKAVFDEVEAQGYMKSLDGYYQWEGNGALLAYLCYQICQHKGFSKQTKDGEKLPDWTRFNGLFKAKGRGKGNWVNVDSNKLIEYKKNCKAFDYKFTPKGYEQIEAVIERHLT
jgi:hypothetical protein